MLEYHDKVCEALEDRSTWEDRQEMWYRMRHDGLVRRKKPYANAANLHYPLIDGSIEKLKPFYYQQIYSSEKLCSFVSLAEGMEDKASAAADFFDYLLRNETDFEEEALSMIDTMLLRGRGVIKIIRDPWKNTLSFEAVDPLYIIVPRGTLELADADFVCHVKEVSSAAYQRDRRYLQDPDVIDRIRGEIDDEPEQTQEKFEREGLTYSTDQDGIIIWEVYWRTPGGWTVHTYSPKAPGLALRRPFGVPFRQKGEPVLPFISFVMEIKDKGWYSPRGISERLAPFESSLCKMWNEKHDFMSFMNKPLFTSTSNVPNTANIRFGPGEILPMGVAPVTGPPPPISWDQEMVSTQRIAEEHIAMPDANIGPADYGRRDNPTATEVSFRRALAQTGVDLKGALFRKRLRDLYKLGWSIVVQYDIGSPAYVVGQSLKILPVQAKSDMYAVQPAGSSDDWNKQQRITQAAARLQMLTNSQYVDQSELVRDFIASNDPRLVAKLWLPGDMKANMEAEDEAIEILGLLEGFPMVVRPNENHQLRIKILLGKLQQLGMLGEPVKPIGRQRLQEHLAIHIQYFKAMNPAAAGQIEQMLMGVEQGAIGAGQGPVVSPPPAPGPAPATQPQPQLASAYG